MLGVTALMVAGSTERYRTAILSVHREALSSRSVVAWDAFGADPTEFSYPYEFRPLYSSPIDWWIDPTHLTLYGGHIRPAAHARRLHGRGVVHADGHPSAPTNGVAPVLSSS